MNALLLLKYLMSMNKLFYCFCLPLTVLLQSLFSFYQFSNGIIDSFNNVLLAGVVVASEGTENHRRQPANCNIKDVTKCKLY
jgi:hypothetical protein